MLAVPPKCAVRDSVMEGELRVRCYRPAWLHPISRLENQSTINAITAMVTTNAIIAIIAIMFQTERSPSGFGRTLPRPEDLGLVGSSDIATQ